MLDFFADVTLGVSISEKLKNFLTTVGIEPTLVYEVNTLVVRCMYI